MHLIPRHFSTLWLIKTFPSIVQPSRRLLVAAVRFTLYAVANTLRRFLCLSFSIISKAASRARRALPASSLLPRVGANKTPRPTPIPSPTRKTTSYDLLQGSLNRLFIRRARCLAASRRCRQKRSGVYPNQHWNMRIDLKTHANRGRTGAIAIQQGDSYRMYSAMQSATGPVRYPYPS